MQQEVLNTIKTTVVVKSIVYPKGSFKVPEGTWGVLKCFDIENKIDVNVSGTLPNINLTKNQHMEYSLVANVVVHAVYGKQYQIVLMQPSLKGNEDNVKNFLLYILTPLQVKTLYNTLDNPLKYIKEKDVDTLCKVKGIKEYTAKKIIAKYEENKQYERAYSELGAYNLSLNIIHKLLNRYKNLQTVKDILQNNPYQLIRDIEGIGWAKADEIGKKVGVPAISTQRFSGAICYFLETQAETGNSWVHAKAINENLLQLFTEEELSNCKEEIIQTLSSAIEQLKEENVIGIDKEKDRIFLMKYYNLERNIARELIRLLDGETFLPTIPIDKVVQEIKQEKNWKLTDEQISGAELFNYCNVGVITGASGTGKSSTVEVLVKAFQGKKIAQVALAGRAASRLSEITKINGMTIHRLLRMQEDLKFVHTRENPLNYDIIIVDEVSMIGGSLFYSLIQAIPTGAKLIMVGDHNQLESIGSLNLLKDLIDSKVIPVQILNKIHRQAQESGIITESFKIKDGCSITSGCSNLNMYTRGKLQDFSLVLNSSQTQEKIIDVFKNEFKKMQDISKIQIIVPMRERGNLAVDKINILIQQYYYSIKHPNTKVLEEDKIIISKKKNQFLLVGDKVINIANNYNCLNLNGDTVEVFNGYIGIVDSIDYDSNTIVVDYTLSYGEEVGKVIYKKEHFADLQLAYAITCHKFQGSETDIIIVGLDYSAYTLLCRQWVYTAITRAKKKCILVADKKALDFATITNRVSSKQTFLPFMLKGEYDINKE